MIRSALHTAVIAVTALLTAVTGQSQVRITNTTGEKVYFQPEAMLGYAEVASADTTIAVPDSPA